MPSLRIKLPNDQGEVTHVLAGEKITIGRRPENTIQIIDRTVSAHHAELIGVNGHYRLHDLGSTNLTCVDGQPVTDFHLHGKCRVQFGTVEAEFSPDTPGSSDEKKSELVPTRSEMEYIRRENLDLLSKIAALQKQIDILGSARLMTKETAQLGVQPEVHRRLIAERDELKQENASLKLDAENLKCDLVALTRDRDAMRQAWETIKAELTDAENALAQARRAAPPHSAAPVSAAAPKPPATLKPTPGLPKTETQPVALADQHRQMAQVLSQAPALVESLRTCLGKLVAAPDDEALRAELLTHSGAIADAALPVAGHPIQRLAAAIAALANDVAPKPGPLESSVLRTLTQGAELIPPLLDPRALKRAKELKPARVFAIDDDQDLLATIVASLQMSDIHTIGRGSATGAIEELRNSEYELVLLDIDLPGANGVDLCGEIRALPGHRQTPIIFLTGANTVENRAQSSLNGGSDFLAKPFNTFELALKAATWVFRGQFGLL